MSNKHSELLERIIELTKKGKLRWKVAYQGQFYRRPKCAGFSGRYGNIYVKLMLKRLKWRVVFPKTSDLALDLVVYGKTADPYIGSWYPPRQWPKKPKPVDGIEVNDIRLDVNHEDITRLRNAILESGLEGKKPETHDTEEQKLQKTLDGILSRLLKE